MPNQEKDDKADSREDSLADAYGSMAESMGSVGVSSVGGKTSGGGGYSGTVGGPNDATSYGDSRLGTGRDSSGVGSNGYGGAGGFSSTDGGYSAYGGDDSPSERTGRGQQDASYGPTETNIADRFNDGGLGTGFASAYRDMANSATGAGISNLAGDSYSRAPTARQSEIDSMNRLDQLRADAKQAFLDTIAGVESNGRYNVSYGGKTFSDFTDHPGIGTRITSGPNAGKISTAAGAFQINEPTWRELASKYNVEDFSPESQRTFAFGLAKDTYKEKTGRDLETDLVSQNPERIAEVADALRGRWEGIKDADRFASTYLGKLNDTTAGKQTPAGEEDIPSYDSLMATAPSVPATQAAMNFNPPPDKIRNQPVQPELTDKVAAAVSRLGPGYGWVTTSGGQSPLGTIGASRTGSTRHDDGYAIDGALTYNGKALTPNSDPEAYQNLMTNLAEEGIGGIGHYAWGIHADLKTPNAWGPDTRSASLNSGFAAAIDQGRALKDLNGSYPTPTPRGESPQANVAYNDEPKQTDAQKAIDKVAAPSADRFKERYLDTPATGPTPEAKPDQPLTTGQKIAAGAIDIGAGLLPGIGTGLGLVNAGLSLTGNRTIGERIVSNLGNSTATLPDATTNSDRDPVLPKEETKTAAATPAPASTPTVARFVNTYLRPTPKEKWARV